MRVTQLETLRLDEFPNLCFVRVHTDAGITGLGDPRLGHGFRRAALLVGDEAGVAPIDWKGDAGHEAGFV